MHNGFIYVYKFGGVKALIFKEDFPPFFRLPERYFQRIIVYCCCTF